MVALQVVHHIITRRSLLYFSVRERVYLADAGARRGKTISCNIELKKDTCVVVSYYRYRIRRVGRGIYKSTDFKIRFYGDFRKIVNREMAVIGRRFSRKYARSNRNTIILYTLYNSILIF